MPSAVLFLPPTMSELMNFATNLSRYLGSGVIFRLGTSRLRDISLSFLYLKVPVNSLRIKPWGASLRTWIACGFGWPCWCCWDLLRQKHQGCHVQRGNERPEDPSHDRHG